MLISLLRLLKLALRPRRAFQLAVAAWRRRRGLRGRFETLREPKAIGPVHVGKAECLALNSALAGRGLAVETRRIDLPAVMAFFERGGYRKRWFYYAGGRDLTVLQKVVEHCTAAELLELTAEDLYLDVASQDSPAPAIYERLFACQVLRQDLSYRAGRHGTRIGGSAESIPLADGSISKMALHNAFEHFEADADTGFMLEAQRLLRPGGRLCILPLFLHPTYSVQTDLALLPPGQELRFDEGARIHDSPGWRDRHGRFYDVPQLVRRVLEPAALMRPRIVHYENAAEVFPGCHMHYAVVFERGANARGVTAGAESSEAVTLEA